jgi:hypothetical protein
VAWPDTIPYYALSSGTSNAASKYIPVTNAMLGTIKKASRRMFYDLWQYHLPPTQLSRHMLMVGGSTELTPEKNHFSGDLSGIMGLNRPAWMKFYYRPGRKITDLPDWESRMEAITQNAPKWDIGYVVGNPMWIQLIFERIIEEYRLEHIHQLWPNLNIMVHGGVAMEPYKANFDRILGKKLHYINNYTASEGFFGYQRPGQPDMCLSTDSGVYFEFVPFDPTNFDDEGNHLATAQALPLEAIASDRPYALLISTCSGAWRYLLGDVVQFTDVQHLRFKIVGRTKQFLSVAGEHLSVDNLNDAVATVNHTLGAGIQEFTVAGLPCHGRWMHQWWMSTEQKDLDPAQLAQALDEVLCALNDDYAVERQHALRRVEVAILPKTAFSAYLAAKGKLNGQAKIPRVMKGTQLEEWLQVHNKITTNTPLLI